MLTYIIQVILFQTVFLAIYDLFLSKETFFTKNRWYLLSATILSFIIPLIKIPTLQESVPVDYRILLPEVILSPQATIEKTQWYQSINYLDVLFYLGCISFSVLFVIKLYKIIRLIFHYKRIKKQNYTLVILPKSTAAFSFFNYVFLGEQIPINQQEKIIAHELVHSKQKHSLDLLLFELLKISMWFNPMIYLFQKRISLIHEYISDEVVSKTSSKEAYIHNLLADVFQVEHISFINQFYKHSLIKKRILMMTKKQSKKVKQLKYLLLVPALSSMLFYTACTNETFTKQQEKEPTNIILNSQNGLKTIELNKPSYFDVFIGKVAPSSKELSKKDLSEEELQEYKLYFNKYHTTKQVKIRIFEGLEDPDKKILFVDSSTFSNKTNPSFYNEKAEYFEEETMPFSTIDQTPNFPGCDGSKDCFHKNIRKHISKQFNADVADNLGLSGKQRIICLFTINKNGVVENIKVRAPHPVLKEEALRVIKSLPKMDPGKHNGKTVNVNYTLPVVFNIN